jgi:hypothetical protein
MICVYTLKYFFFEKEKYVEFQASLSLSFFKISYIILMSCIDAEKETIDLDKLRYMIDKNTQKLKL